MTIRNHGSTFRRDERGSVLLEFALMVTLLLILMFGIIDLGRALFTANNLASAAREGARYGSSLMNPNPDNAPQIAAIKLRVQNAFSPFGGAPLSDAQIVVECDYGAGPIACSPNNALRSIRVRINYPFTWITPIQSLVGSMANVLHGQALYRWEGTTS